ncbi:MAG: HAD family phosphatase [Elusimicrobiota bacterium]|jgi:HAD superfamily hydrolase (TIGR01509 family)|nr:HAD family phosphatase [Elusimicrobiota bacterium]
MTIKNVIFDVGGVFVKWDPKAIFKKYFNSDKEVDDFMKEIDFEGMNEKGDLGSESVTDMMRNLAEKFPQYKEPILEYDRNWLDTIVFEYKGTRNLAIVLKKSGYKIYILSNWESDKFKLFDSKYKILEIFDGYVLSGDVHEVKPYHPIYKILLEKYGLKAEECAFLDDRPENVAGANALGMKGFVFVSANQAKIDLESAGVKIK